MPSVSLDAPGGHDVRLLPRHLVGLVSRRVGIRVPSGELRFDAGGHEVACAFAHGLDGAAGCCDDEGFFLEGVGIGLIGGMGGTRGGLSD